jgi:hypothetical protein
MAGANNQGRIWEQDKKSKSVYLRDGFIAAFFLPTPIHETVKEIARAFEAYIAMIPPDALRWESVGANAEEWKAFSKTTVKRCLAQLDVAAAKKRELTAFHLTDGNEGGEAPGYGVWLEGGKKDSDWPDQTTIFQVFFPSGAANDPDAFVANVRTLAAMLPYHSGYASPALHYAPDLLRNVAMNKARSVVARYPGYDVHANETACLDQDHKVRGARWLTFLGPDIVKELGGRTKVEDALSRPVIIEPVGHGLMIRAGKEPEIGDVAKKVGTPHLRMVAKILEPVTKFDEDELIGVGFAKNKTDPFLPKWQRRFLD